MMMVMVMMMMMVAMRCNLKEKLMVSNGLFTFVCCERVPLMGGSESACT